MHSLMCTVFLTSWLSDASYVDLFLSTMLQICVAGHALGVLANWVVQLVLDIYRYIRASFPTKKEEGRKQIAQDNNKDFNRLIRKTAGNTLKIGASLVLASVGAGLGTILIKPSTGTWIGKHFLLTYACSRIFLSPAVMSWAMSVSAHRLYLRCFFLDIHLLWRPILPVKSSSPYLMKVCTE